MENISIQNLNALFTFLNYEKSSALWIRSKDYQRQIYLADNFENFCGLSPEVICKSPEISSRILLAEDLPHVMSSLQKEISQPEQAASLLFYRIVNSNKNIFFIKDYHFMLADENGHHVGFAGLASAITEQEWHEGIIRKKSVESSANQEKLKKDVFTILQKELKIQAVTPGLTAQLQNQPKNNGHSISLTAREVSCLYYLSLGKSAKQTAALMNISPRTVVFHLDNIRSKTGCRNKIELLGKLHSNALTLPTLSPDNSLLLPTKQELEDN